MKNDKTESLRVRVSPAMRLKLIQYAQKKDISEAAAIRLALKKFLPTNTPKSTKQGDTMDPPRHTYERQSRHHQSQGRRSIRERTQERFTHN